MKTVNCALIKNWDGVVEQAAIVVGQENVQLTFDDGVSHQVSHLWFMDNVVGLVCACGEPLKDHAEKYFGRCEKHIPIYCVRNEEEFDENTRIEENYKNESMRWSN